MGLAFDLLDPAIQSLERVFLKGVGLTAVLYSVQIDVRRTRNGQVALFRPRSPEICEKFDV